MKYAKILLWILLTLSGPVSLWVIGASISSAACAAKWENSSYRYKYKMIGGCMIHVPPVGWIPSENFRYP